MKRSKAISKAAQRISTPTLPSDFNARLMVSVTRQARRQRRTEIITSIIASMGIIAMIVYGVILMLEIDFPKINFGIRLDADMSYHMRMWGIPTVFVVAMLVAEMFIRQHIRMHKIRDEIKK